MYFFIYICSTLSSSPQTMVWRHPHTFRPGGALHFGAPNEGTNNGESANDAASLVWAHREQRLQDLGPWWQMLPWRERAKAAEGLGGGGSCWLLCVVVVFCVVARDRVLILPIL